MTEAAGADAASADVEGAEKEKELEIAPATMKPSPAGIAADIAAAAEVAFKEAVTGVDVLPVSSQCLQDLHCEAFLRNWINEKVWVATSEADVKACLAQWEVQANAVKAMIGSMTRSRKDMASWLSTKERRAQQAATKEEEKTRGGMRGSEPGAKRRPGTRRQKRRQLL